MPATIRQLLNKRIPEKIFTHLQHAATVLQFSTTPGQSDPGGPQLNGRQIAPVNADPGRHFS
ncbi:hypothetical protein ECAI27_46800 [Escherichia coli AI27]|nr:hypothetical protein ECAI27_46800 [Escherichia coli AI27]